MSTTSSYLDSFRRLPGGVPAPLAALRERAIATFGERGFPTTRDEEWRYTSVAALTEHPFPLAAPARLAGDEVAALRTALLPDTAAALVFVNGLLAAELSQHGAIAGGVLASSLGAPTGDQPDHLHSHLSSCLAPEHSAFTALNTAFLRDGALVHVPRHTRLSQPIHLVFANRGGDTPAVAHPRVLIVAEEGSDFAVIEHHFGLGGGPYWSNAVTEIVVGAGARVTHYKLQDEAPDAFHIGTTAARQAGDSTFVSHSVALGARLARNDVATRFESEGGSCALDGLYLLDGQRHADQHTSIDHATARCSSAQLYKGILDGAARAVFNGKIIVHPNAQRTDARQMNKNLLLSPDAEIDTKPQLEIFADDVKCSHGASIGRLDEESLFYLRARGIGAAEARAMLTFAFANELVERVALAPWRERLEGLIRERFAVAGRGRSA